MIQYCPNVEQSIKAWIDIVSTLFSLCFIYTTSRNRRMNITSEEIKVRIIRKLVKWRKWGGSHTETVISGLPAHLCGAKITKQALAELVKDEWLLAAKKTGEIHYSLNPKKAQEILQFYEEQGSRIR